MRYLIDTNIFIYLAMACWRNMYWRYWKTMKIRYT